MTQKSEPNIYEYPGASNQAIYDLENSIADPDKLIEKALEEYESFDGKIIVDIGAGGGLHAVEYAQKAEHVYAVEPSHDMLKQLYHRVSQSGKCNISILATHAEDIPLKDETVDIIHSRFAYFFGPEDEYIRSCIPGIKEAIRILKPRGRLFIIDNTWNSGLFSTFLIMTSGVDGDEIQLKNEKFYRELGFQHRVVKSRWKSPDRESLEKVIAMEFGETNRQAIMKMFEGCEIEYHYSIYTYQK